MANGGVTTEQRMERRAEVAKNMATLTRHSPTAERLAIELGCSISTIWDDRKWILEQAAKASEGLSPEAVGQEFLVRLRSAQAAAAEDGAHGAVMTGFGHEAKVLGLNAAEKVDVTVGAKETPLPAAFYELTEKVYGENARGELEGKSAEWLWSRFDAALSERVAIDAPGAIDVGE